MFCFCLMFTVASLHLEHSSLMRTGIDHEPSLCRGAERDINNGHEQQALAGSEAECHCSTLERCQSRAPSEFCSSSSAQVKHAACPIPIQLPYLTELCIFWGVLQTMQSCMRFATSWHNVSSLLSAVQFLSEHLRMKDVRMYVRDALRQYASLQSFTPQASWNAECYTGDRLLEEFGFPYAADRATVAKAYPWLAEYGKKECEGRLPRREVEKDEFYEA